ncbi:RNA polymerase sigma factor [Arenivirga flava]|uniref:RNA polymerase sigma-70 region 2 domain-containing protein n=1 Tax=Arenivirga flava TaxID=1930060 RepID=A0AA37X9W9_9MICO|nr:sigma-70 family RNA polymerase sigma factor [Arenivirga flava]GMA29084.1 hypothetical protein GCM10025874_23370 [Arenivirga flava]
MPLAAPPPARGGAAASLPALFTALHAELLRQARSHGASSTDAEDVVAEAFLTLLRLPGERLPRNPRAYLHAIVRNAMRRTGSASREVPTPMEELDRPVVDPDRLEAAEQTALIERAIAGLSSREQRLLHGSLVERLGIERLARELGLSTTATTTAVARARTNLRVAYLAATLEARLSACGAPPEHLARVLLGTASGRMRLLVERHSAACEVCRGILRGD